MRRHTVYGLRLKGDKEVRYVGYTNVPVETRLDGHFSAIGLSRHNPPLCARLAENRDGIEIFKIAYAETKEEGFAIEKTVIALCLRLEHRLFNQRPADLCRDLHPRKPSYSRSPVPVPAMGARRRASTCAHAPAAHPLPTATGEP